ncbi:MAG: HD domain protein, partial [Lachnospiraceae bacterium]|nr:HD domain protein [Lachnospiraceae bacterium]
MKNWKTPVTVLFVAVCVLINCFGKAVADRFGLPLWLDSFGTVLSAYIMGPVCGAIVGFSANTIYSFFVPSSFIYGLTSIVIGISTGIAARRGWFENLFRVTSASVFVTFASVIVSVPLNYIFYSGNTGNRFGDGVIGYFMSQGVFEPLCYVVGEFYIDFLDKVITLLAVFCLIRIYRYRRKNKKKSEAAAAAVLVLLLLPVFTVTARADEAIDFDSYVQTVYSTENGLPCGEANDIAMTKDGILWIGTYAGLYRYNGSEFRLMNDYESVRNVNCLYVDDEGRLWIGTNDRGLAICINEEVVNVVDTQKGLPSDSIRSLVRSNDGLYYVGTSDSMQVIDLNGGLVMKNVIEEVKYSQCSSAGPDGYVAAVTSTGEAFLLKDGEVKERLTLTTEQEVYMSCCFDRDGSLYIGTSKGCIYKFVICNDKLIRKDEHRFNDISTIKSIVSDNKGGHYICADEGIGYMYSDGDFTKVNTGTFHNAIDHMLIDYQGNLWFTSTRLGLLRMTKASFSNLYKVAGLEEKVINSVCRWQDLLYVGTDSGLDIIDEKRNEHITNAITTEVADVRIRCVFADSRNDLWLCTFGKGLIKVTPDRDITYYDQIGSRARMIRELKSGEMVVSTDVGVSWINENGKVTETIPYGDDLGNASVLCLLELPDETVLAGTDGEGIAVIRDKKVVKVINREDGLSSGVILRLVNDGDEGVFVVTSNGLCYIDDQLNARSINNFPYYNNYDIEVFEDGRAFIPCSAGVYVAEREDLIEDKKDMLVELLDSKRGLMDSLTANAWNFRDENDNLYLSSDKGVYKLAVRSYHHTKSSYRMMVSA